jgi:aminoglycoside phosphotransferase (APT) family kinase protein
MSLEAQLVAYLQHRLPGAAGVRVTGLHRIPGGASRETWAFDACWSQADGERSQGFILRRDPDASLLETDRDVEYQLYRALEGTPVPVPRVFWLETDPRWLERPFFLMERIEGETSPQALMLPEHDSVRPQLGRQKLAILAEIHRLDWQERGLGFLRQPDRPDRAWRTELEHWRSTLRRDALEAYPVLHAALRWLERHPPPPPRGITVVHGDYRTGNFLYREGRIVGVLDWEMVHLGDPMEDIAWMCLSSWRWRRDGLVGGLLDREEAYRLYEELTGTPVDREAVFWWEVLGNVKLATIFVTGARSYCDGKTREIMMALVARFVPPLERELVNLLGW